MIRRLTALVTIACVGFCSTPALAQYSTVFDPWAHADNMQSFAQRQTAYSQQVKEYLEVLKEVNNEIEQLKLLKQSVEQLPADQMRQLSADLGKLEDVMHGEHQLVLKESRMDNVFKGIYHPYDPGMDFGRLYQTWDKNTHDAAHDALDAARAILHPAEAPSKTYAKNIGSVKTSAGQTAAIQAVGTIGAQQVEQLQKLQQLDAYRTSFEVQYYLQSTSTMSKAQQREDAALKWICSGAPQSPSCATKDSTP